MPSVTIQDSGFTPQRARDAHFAAAVEQMDAGMVQVEGEAKRLAPSRTGHLRRSLTHLVEVRGNMIIGSVGTTLFYGRFVDQGTGLYGPHRTRVVPKTPGGILRFPQPGNKGFTAAGRVRSGKAGARAAFVVVRSTRGMKATHFFSRALESSRTTWTRELRQIPGKAQAKLTLMGVK